VLWFSYGLDYCTFYLQQLNSLCIVIGKKGQYVWTEGQDEEALSRGIYNTYTSQSLRYSQVTADVLFQTWDMHSDCYTVVWARLLCFGVVCAVCAHVRLWQLLLM